MFMVNYSYSLDSPHPLNETPNYPNVGPTPPSSLEMRNFDTPLRRVLQFTSPSSKSMTTLTSTSWLE
jgi:hypothetical protein